MSADRSRVLVAEQAALRRVATLVARGVAPEEVFTAVVEEVRQLLPVEFAHMIRYESDGAITFVAASSGADPVVAVGSRWGLGGKNLATGVFETGRPVRIDNFADASGPIGVLGRGTAVRSAVATPIIVEGRLWGAMTAGAIEHPLPARIEERLAQFTGLLAMAVANAESRAGLTRLAAEQTALRRFATLVARGVPPEQVFAAVVEEIGRLLSVASVGMGRYEADGTVTSVAAWGTTEQTFSVGSRWSLEGKNLMTNVFETGEPARIDEYAPASGPIGVAARDTGFRSAVATPIAVDGRLWGVVVAASTLEQPLPPDTEARLAAFTELVAMAIANAQSRAELTASRARIVVAADETRRRIERDLHDGAQQRLVHAAIVQQLALRALKDGDAGVSDLMAEALQHTEQAIFELSELAHGILPAVLTREGLRAGVHALVSRASLPVSVDVCVERLPADVEATAYFVVSEALTNVAKHAQASSATVKVWVERSVLRVEVRDDGGGGAHAESGTGLHGLQDRVAALDGRLVVESPPGHGTLVSVLLPVAK